MIPEKTIYDDIYTHDTDYDIFGLPKENLQKYSDMSGSWVSIEDYQELLSAYHSLRRTADALLEADERGGGVQWSAAMTKMADQIEYRNYPFLPDQVE